MRMRVALAGTLIVAVAVLGLFAARPRAAEEPYQLIKDIQIGGEGGWDYLNVDSAAKRLYSPLSMGRGKLDSPSYP